MKMTNFDENMREWKRKLNFVFYVFCSSFFSNVGKLK